jgi:cell division protein YceG involved in septum cleavage
MKKTFTLLFAVLFAGTVLLSAQDKTAAKPVYTEASDLTLVGKLFTDTPNPYHRVDTLIHKGFTPTPICTPSIECLQAAMDPAYTNYLFFYIVDDGERSIHEFTETYDEHLDVIDSAGQSGQE